MADQNSSFHRRAGGRKRRCWGAYFCDSRFDRYVSCRSRWVYGYRADATPNVVAFADQGTIFVHADSQIPLTLPSHDALFTSTYPFQNRIEENAERVGPGAVTLAAVLRSHGYKTAAFVSSVFLEREMGLDQGFDFYDSPFQFEAFSPLSGSMFFSGATRFGARDRRDGALAVHAALEWLSQNRGQPVFCFVHLYDLHKPYKRGSYDAELRYTDEVLGGLRKGLEAAGWWDRALVVLLADHGESLGEHGEASHGYFIYESTLAVPLIFHWPEGARPLGSRVEQAAGLVDVAPTILDFLHLTAPESFEGASLLRGVEHPIYAESVHAHDSFGWAPLRSLRVGDLKYIEAPKAELYNLREDPAEKVNLAAKNPDEARRLRGELGKMLARYAARPAANGNVSPETRALLGSLGYLAPGPGVKVAGTGADPKDRLAEFQLYERAMVLLYERHVSAAIAVLRRILVGDPKNTLARRDLGDCYLEEREYRAARAQLARVAAVVPDDYVSQYELGIADERLRLWKEARAHLEIACKLAPEAGSAGRSWSR
ncbi:MAG TPA: sulfatase-like hydrolase/transferase [Bryobacteraceae bacterium]|nr:sulfatase-like hydrolase/transferase [Bryobacteraceae bacterium]